MRQSDGVDVTYVQCETFPNRIYAETASICVTIYLLLLVQIFGNEGQEDGPGRNLPKTIYEIGEPVIQRETIGRRETLEKRGGCRPPNAKLLVGSGDNANLMPLFGEPFE